MNNIRERLSNVISRMENNDKKLAEELRFVRNEKKFQELAGILHPRLGVSDSGLESLDDNFALETIVLRVGRPVLTVANDAAILKFSDAESEIWRDRLTKASRLLTTAIKSVGRIEVTNHPSFEWLGTGWLVAENIIITNRHVAEVFGKSNGAGFVFRQGRGGLMGANVDFIEEAGRTDEFTFQLEKILHIEDERGPDLALLRVKPIGGRQLPKPISLGSSIPEEKHEIAVIGYPARDSRIPDQQLMLDIFGDVYDKKRLAPGQVTGISEKELLHDCSTLGGNSGSVVLDLATGEALGLHFAGRFLEKNFAVPAALIKQRLRRIGESSNGTMVHTNTDANKPAPKPKKEYSDPAPSKNALVTGDTPTLRFSIPLEITVSVGAATNHTLPTASANATNGIAVQQQKEAGETFITEAVPADYTDRIGYQSSFLEEEVPRPVIESTKRKKDILKFDFEGREEEELKYTHFSVVMSKSRRQCFFSAVNIDGKTSIGMKRGGWRLDPRIPEDAQIMHECYGNPPKFSRGHMTRREDPIWGGEEDARQGNTDSMHVTNTVPQMQSMNAGIWLGLENYALHNARKDDMRISVFTGPVFKSNDPVRFGVKIPVSFWKVIAFIHDDTGRLCATGYRISQEDFLQEEEFVFGAHKTTQVPIASIERLTGMSFGHLSDLDPLNTINESLDTLPTPIADYDQIRFV